MISFDCNFVVNGRFNTANNWEFLSGAQYDPSIGEEVDGVTSFGSAALAAAAQELAQANIYLPALPSFTLSFAYLAAADGQLQLKIYNDTNDLIFDDQIDLTGGAWVTYEQKFGFLTDTYKISFTYTDVNVNLDNISIAHIPKTKLELAEDTANSLGSELTVGISPPVDSDNLGDYTQAVDDGLRWVDAVNSLDAADPRCLAPSKVGDCLDRIEEIMATGKVLNYFQTLTDTTLGSRSEKFSQIARAIREQYGLVAGADDKTRRKFSTIPLVHPRWPTSGGAK